MAMKKKSTIGLSSAALSLLSLIVCAALSLAIANLIVIPMMNADKPATMLAGSPLVVAATATIPTDEDSPLPGTPTGEIPKPFPTLDLTQRDKIPTSVIPDDVPTLEPEPTDDTIPPPPPPLLVDAPSEDRKTYSDPILGFSFEYPSNWQLQRSGNDSNSGQVDVDVVVWNFNGGDKSDVTTKQFKFELFVQPKPDAINTVEDWKALYTRDYTKIGVVFQDVSTATINDLEAVRWIASNYPAAPEPTLQVYILKEGYIYRITGYPGNSDYSDVFEQMLNSLRIP